MCSDSPSAFGKLISFAPTLDSYAGIDLGDPTLNDQVEDAGTPGEAFYICPDPQLVGDEYVGPEYGEPTSSNQNPKSTTSALERKFAAEPAGGKSGNSGESHNVPVAQPTTGSFQRDKPRPKWKGGHTGARNKKVPF